MSSSTANTRSQRVSLTMSFLSLCADSGRPPGLLHHPHNNPGTIKTTGYHSHDKRQHNVTSTHNRTSISTVTPYYKSFDTAYYPNTNPHSFSLSHLHVISMLTSHSSWLPVYFITSSWLRFFFCLLMSIILLVIPLPDLDNTDNHQQHEFDNNWTYETRKHHPWQHSLHPNTTLPLPWHQQYLHHSGTPQHVTQSANKQQQ